jgi:hypothetical protein
MNFLIYTLDAAGDTHKNVNHIVEARNKNNVYCWAPVATREAEIRRIAISGLAQAKKKKKKKMQDPISKYMPNARKDWRSHSSGIVSAQ